jgi:hypothetical protein
LHTKGNPDLRAYVSRVSRSRGGRWTLRMADANDEMNWKMDAA